MNQHNEHAIVLQTGLADYVFTYLKLIIIVHMLYLVIKLFSII